MAAPSETLFVALSKEQLVSVADHYVIGITLPKSAKKDQVGDFIRERLKEKHILPGGTPIDPINPVKTFPDNHSVPLTSPKTKLTYDQ